VKYLSFKVKVSVGSKSEESEAYEKIRDVVFDLKFKNALVLTDNWIKVEDDYPKDGEHILSFRPRSNNYPVKSEIWSNFSNKNEYDRMTKWKPLEKSPED